MARDLASGKVFPVSEAVILQTARKHGIGRKMGRAVIFSPEDCKNISVEGLSSGRLSRQCDGGVAPAGRCRGVGATPYHLINNLLMRIYSNKDSPPDQDDIKGDLEAVSKFLRLLEVERVETLGEPAIDRSEKVAGARVDGRIVVAIAIESDGDRITAIFGISNPDKLNAIAH
jgi:hypothetical protein